MNKFKEIEAFYKISWQKLLRKLHLIQRMSCPQISEKFQQDMGIDYTSRAVQRWLKKFSYLRQHDEALRNRVITGRMDYSQRQLDYEARHIDYAGREKKKGNLWASGLAKLLRNKGDTSRLSKTLGQSDGSEISAWKNLRRKVSPEYQEKICAYFGLDKEAIFTENKSFDIPIKITKSHINQKAFLRKQGYRYAANLKKLLYKRRLTLSDLADKLEKPIASMSKWASKKGLVSPVDQQRVEKILRYSNQEIFR